VKVTLRFAWLLLCLPAMPLFLCAQAQTPATPTTPATGNPPATPAPSATTPATPATPGALPPPRNVLNDTNTGTGLSIEGIYWLTRGNMLLRTGDYNNSGVSSDLDYPGKLDHALGATVIVPASKNGSVRFTYFQTSMTGSTVAPQNLILFGGTEASVGDPLASQAQLANYKLSYDYVTYYWKHKGGDVRLKTLYEMQYTSINTTVEDFQLQTNGTYVVNPLSGTTSIILPTFGLGLDGTVSKYFRWETRASGFGLPHRSKIGDGEADVAVRWGHVELIAGARAYYFRTSRRSAQFNTGAPFGPYVGLRLYWKKK
jgi:hypothetical protein